ncbi:substrate-binding periplasmic protein [Curvivirga aplysinae]|uniref:substrate-binding periplasmic protein n=1 Tax=Curvivirga aplysinae TaxID=2529852 RepID=UPI0012BC31AB|nr:transporter substrate-binding domain-containing protein [Curvivirga aplysinae]MTI10936.1 transporter substrate-binding domain-containing protein [Curvivirga aplysinae]
MKVFKRNIAVMSAMIFMALGISHVVAAERLEILSVHYPPFIIENSQDGRLGYDVEVTELALREAGYDPVFVFQDWETIQNRVKDGSATAIQSCTHTQKREEWIEFSNPLSYSTRGFFALKRNIRLIEPVMLDALDKYSVTAVKDYGTAFELENAGLSLGEKPLTDKDAFFQLEDGGVDLFYSTGEFGKWYAQKELGFDDSLRFYKRKGRPYYLCVSKNWPNYKTVISKFNNALARIRQDGRYDKIHARYGN